MPPLMALFTAWWLGQKKRNVSFEPMNNLLERTSRLGSYFGVVVHIKSWEKVNFSWLSVLKFNKVMLMWCSGHSNMGTWEIWFSLPTKIVALHNSIIILRQCKVQSHDNVNVWCIVWVIPNTRGCHTVTIITAIMGAMSSNFQQKQSQKKLSFL